MQREREEGLWCGSERGIRVARAQQRDRLVVPTEHAERRGELHGEFSACGTGQPKFNRSLIVRDREFLVACGIVSAAEFEGTTRIRVVELSDERLDACEYDLRACGAVCPHCVNSCLPAL